jgi:multiple sugar transport system permease protein
MYQDAFKWWDLGLASAEAFVLFLIMFAVTAVFMKLMRRGGQA